MKWLIVLIVILAAFALVALRYRRQLLAGWQLYKMYQKMGAAGKPPTEKRINKTKTAREETGGDQLVRCSRCNKWISPTQAVNLRGKNTYCSTACLEKAVKIASLVD